MAGLINVTRNINIANLITDIKKKFRILSTIAFVRSNNPKEEEPLR